MAKKNKVSVVFVLDKSGSMQDVKESTISGFNEYVGALKNDKESEYRMTLSLFDSHVSRRLTAAPISEVQKLSSENYQPNGNTALYDAVCETLLDHENQSADKTLVVVMTDGEENSSTRYTERDFRNFARLLKSTGGVSFVFLGANQDAWKNAEKWGFSRQNVATYNSTDIGTRAAFQMMASNTTSYAASAQNSTADFFSKDDQQKLGGAK